MSRHWILVVFTAVVIGFSGCECEDCGPLLFNPSFQAQFFNRDSIQTLNDTIDFYDALSTDFNERINELTDLIANSEDPDEIIALTNEQIQLQNLRTETDSIADLFADNRDSVAAGWLIINKITNIANQNEEIPDTLNIYPIPLPPVNGAGSANYEFDILGTLYRMDVTFVTQESVDNYEEIRLRLLELTVDTTTMSFDTLVITEDGIYQFDF